MEREAVCEWKDHKGDPKKNHGKGQWWLKDPEWKYLCPNCVIDYWVKKLKKWGRQ